MNVVSLSSSNYIGLSASYNFDNTLQFDQDILYTENGISLPLARALKNLNDNTINNFSSLYLTSKTPITGSLYIQDLAPIKDEGFSTYIATNALNGIQPTSKFLVVEEPDIRINTAVCKMTGTYEFIDNRYMFDIQFISDRFCKISHENDNITRYLTVDYLGNLVFAKDAKTDYLGDQSPQIFYYVYDRASDVIVFLKNVNDVSKYIIFNAQLQSLSLSDPLTAADIPYITRAIFKCIPRSDPSNNTNLYDSWVGYNKNLKINSQDINPQRSYQSVPGNLLINSEYYTVTATELPVNILSLKNSNTPENNQTRGNPYQRRRSNLLNESEVEMRDYKKLFTGSNQLYGNDNITVGYESYTTDITLKKDKITYFHIPQITYPYVQLNINDSGLIESGAIPGDHPLKSDKIFKKLGSYKYTTPFGEVSDEATGNFLCSWLSGNWDINTRPVWMDRYYNPSQVSFLKALSADPFQSIKYITLSDCLFNEVEEVLGKVDVFDKPSDLIFEPGAYYAYHHYGPNDVENYISSLQEFKTVNGFNTFLKTDGLPVLPYNAQPEEYEFNGERYTITGSLSDIQNTGELTLSFWAKTSDWSRPFGDMIIGNYSNDGFGIFNQNITTPTLYVNSVTGFSIINTDLRKIKEITYNNNAQSQAIIRLDNITNYYIIFNDGFIKKYNPADTELKSVYNASLQNYRNHDNDDSTIFVLCSSLTDPNTQNIVTQINIPSVGITNYTPRMLSQGTYRCALDPIATNPWNSSDTEQKFNKATTLDYYDNYLYFTPGKFTRRVNNTIYYLKDNQTIVKWEDIKSSTTLQVTTAFKSYTQIEDFNIDFENNLWILASDNTFFKYTLNREFILSGRVTNPSFTNYKIGFIADFVNGAYNQRVLLSQKGTIPVRPDPFRTYDLDIAASTQYLSNSAIPASYFTTSPTLSVLFENGINNGQTIVSNIYYNIITFNPVLTPYFEQIPGVDTFINNYTQTIEASIFQPLSASGILFSVLDTRGRLLFRSSMYALTGFNFDPTNSDYLRKFVVSKYKSPSINFKATMVNKFDEFKTRTVDIVYSLSALDPGYHHFAVRVDTYEGYMTVFIDGQKIGMQQFDPRKYEFNNFNNRPFLIGTNNFINSIPLFKYIKKNTSLVSGLTIKDFRIFKRALKDTDIGILAKENNEIEDIIFTVPAGRRNYIEEIERYFKAKVPGQKSTLYNVLIKNSGITDEKLKDALEKRILGRLQQLSPVYTKLNTIKWVN